MSLPPWIGQKYFIYGEAEPLTMDKCVPVGSQEDCVGGTVQYNLALLSAVDVHSSRVSRHFYSPSAVQPRVGVTF